MPHCLFSVACVLSAACMVAQLFSGQHLLLTVQPQLQLQLSLAITDGHGMA